jgi:hypothetical protein
VLAMVKRCEARWSRRILGPGWRGRFWKARVWRGARGGAGNREGGMGKRREASGEQSV